MTSPPIQRQFRGPRPGVVRSSVMGSEIVRVRALAALCLFGLHFARNLVAAVPALDHSDSQLGHTAELLERMPLVFAEVPLLAVSSDTPTAVSSLLKATGCVVAWMRLQNGRLTNARFASRGEPTTLCVVPVDAWRG
jgi:hypothetical protein